MTPLTYIHSLFFITGLLSAYFVAFLFALRGITQNIEHYGKMSRWIGLTGFILHTAYIVFWSIVSGIAPYRVSYGSTLILAWALMLIFIAVDLRWKIKITSIFVLPITITMLGLAQVFLDSSGVLTQSHIKSSLLNIHIIAALLAYASFVFAFAASVMYYLQERHLRLKKFDGLYKVLPALELCDKLNMRAIEFGYPFFTLSILLGSILAVQQHGLGGLFSTKSLLTFAVWFFYGIFLYTRLVLLWRGRLTARLSLIGFLLVMTSFIGIYLLNGTLSGV